MANLMIHFYQREWKNESKSQEAGRAIFEDREFIRIIVPGDKNSEIDRLVEDADRQKYAQEYARFKAGARESYEGTPLAEWPKMSRSMVKEWEFLNVFTVEQLAGLSDTAMQAFGRGGREWVEMAKAHLELARDSAAGEKYAAENHHLRSELEALRRQVEELAQVADQQKRGPGRPRKVEMQEAETA